MSSAAEGTRLLAPTGLALAAYDRVVTGPGSKEWAKENRWLQESVAKAAACLAPGELAKDLDGCLDKVLKLLPLLSTQQSMSLRGWAKSGPKSQVVQAIHALLDDGKELRGRINTFLEEAAYRDLGNGRKGGADETVASLLLAVHDPLRYVFVKPTLAFKPAWVLLTGSGRSKDVPSGPDRIILASQLYGELRDLWKAERGFSGDLFAVHSVLFLLGQPGKPWNWLQALTPKNLAGWVHGEVDVAEAQAGIRRAAEEAAFLVSGNPLQPLTELSMEQYAYGTGNPKSINRILEGTTKQFIKISQGNAFAYGVGKAADGRWNIRKSGGHTAEEARAYYREQVWPRLAAIGKAAWALSHAEQLPDGLGSLADAYRALDGKLLAVLYAAMDSDRCYERYIGVLLHERVLLCADLLGVAETNFPKTMAGYVQAVDAIASRLDEMQDSNPIPAFALGRWLNGESSVPKEILRLAKLGPESEQEEEDASPAGGDVVHSGGGDDHSNQVVDRERNVTALPPTVPPTNLILYGPPGTGKTHHSIARAVRLADPETYEQVKENRAAMSQRFRELQAAGRIEFVTFHQSYGYEDFVESIRPVLADEKDEEGCGGPVYELFRGTFKRIADTAAEAWRRAEGPAAVDTGDVDLEHVRYWKMSLGRAKDPDEAHIFKECVEKGLLRLGYGRSVDFEGCNTRAEVEKKASALGQGETTFNVDAIHRFKNEMQVGDLVVVSDGNRRYRAVGQVAGPYKLRLDLERSQQTRPVKWLRVLPESLPAEQLLKINFSQQTIYRLDRDDLNMHALRELLASPKPNRRADYVLIIDEINRGNISKVLGELITLLEPDKRLGGANELLLRLPSSPEKLFGVPPNLHIVGTMNTADRSIALMDVALRRRFVFEELMPCSQVIREVLGACEVAPGFLELLVGVFEGINGRIRYLYDRDHQLGHSFFLNAAGAKPLREVFLQRVIPLLQEYFYGDWEKVCLVLGCPVDEKGKCSNPNPIVVAKLPDEKLFSQRYLRTTELKPDFEVNPAFLLAASDEELMPFFTGIVGLQA